MGTLTIKADGLDSNRWCLKCDLHFRSETENAQHDHCPNCGSEMITAVLGYTPYAGGASWKQANKGTVKK